MSPLFNQEQTTFILSMLSSIRAPLTGTVQEVEQALAADLDTQLQALVTSIGPWQIVWGPAVYQAPGSNHADNVMFVARSATTPPQLVVSIAGTNPASVFDWLVEDFFVGAQVPWAYGNPPLGSQPKIAAGTFVGLTILQRLAPGPGLPGAGLLLQDFLTTAFDQAMNVITTGHSLGGALSPTFGLWLFDTQTTWDPHAQATVFCQPSAGPTPGNGDFAAYYTQSALGRRTTRIDNSLDIVPQAWNDTTLSQIPMCYAPAIMPDALVDFLVSWARDAAQGGDYTPINLTASPLDGTINTTIIDPNATAFANFLAQAGYQHVHEYLILLGITPSAPILKAVQALLPPAGVVGIAESLQHKLERRQAMAAAVHR